MPEGSVKNMDLALQAQRELTIMKILICVAALFLMTGVIHAEEKGSDTRRLYQQAKEAIKAGDENRADYFLARYMGLTVFDKDARQAPDDLEELFKDYKVSKPISFISGYYDKEFLDWFIFASHTQWVESCGGISEKKYSVEIISSHNDNYFAAFVGYPYLEGWVVIGENSYQAVLALIDNKRKPFIVWGRMKNDKPVEWFDRCSLDTALPLQHVWEPEFHDIDGDGTPEIWLRYNMALADGFSQELNIYKVKGKKLELLKNYEGPTEGIARRLSDGSIEVARGFGDGGHLAYDKHQGEVYKYNKGEFKKISERDIPHILRSSEWKKYYFNK